MLAHITAEAPEPYPQVFLPITEEIFIEWYEEPLSPLLAEITLNLQAAP